MPPKGALAVQSSTMQYSTVQYSTVQSTHLHTPQVFRELPPETGEGLASALHGVHQRAEGSVAGLLGLARGGFRRSPERFLVPSLRLRRGEARHGLVRKDEWEERTDVDYFGSRCERIG